MLPLHLFVFPSLSLCTCLCPPPSPSAPLTLRRSQKSDAIFKIQSYLSKWIGSACVWGQEGGVGGGRDRIDTEKISTLIRFITY